LHTTELKTVQNRATKLVPSLVRTMKHSIL